MVFVLYDYDVWFKPFMAMISDFWGYVVVAG